MATNIVSRATVNLTVNGGNSATKLEELRARSEAIKKEITEIQNGGTKDSPRIRALRKEFEQVGKTITKCQTEIGRVTDVLGRLDKASPKELRQTLNSLKRGLDSIERGSKAWESQVAMIKRVEAELKKVNATLATAESRWNRMNRWLNDTQTFLMGAAAALTGFVMAGRKAVNEFADMDESMTNTKKYTGLTEKQVKELNETFKKTDTRLTREQLNLLAQEAGRLGKNTIKNVNEYTEAASIINVALVDLGEGATQTIAKLANIFGVEQQLGTKKAMLSIGSAVNVLSQNCTASKPYLVDFAQRMAGIGAQAGLTVPQILAFGAVLDANGQKVEMSATAIQKIIMALANKNKEFSQVLGLDADKLAKTLNRSAKEGIMMYLEAIKKLSDNTSANNATVALAPLFKDMGMDAARVATVLSTLANHIDELKWQFGEADKAFREATSASHEFELFNNTAQASIDKAKKSVSELAIELGEKLYPVMKHVYTSSGIFLRVLKTIVTFIFDHAGALASLTAAIIAYTLAAKAATIQTKGMAAAQALATVATKTWKAAGLLCNAVIALMTGNLTKAKTAWQLFSVALKANPIGLLVSVLTAAAVAIYNLVSKTDEFKKSMDEAMKSATSFSESTAREIKEIDKLFGALKGAEKGTKEYDEAKKGIISKYGIYLKGLIDEKGEIINLALAYERLTFAAQRSAQARALNSAKEHVDTTYFQEIDNLTEELRKALENMGVEEMTISRLVTSVSQSIGAGNKISSKDFNEIRKLTEKNLGIIQNIFGDSPIKVVEKINERSEYYAERKEKLDAMDNRYLKKTGTSEIDSLIDYLSESLRTVPLKEIEVKLPVIDKETTEKINEIITRNVYDESLMIKPDKGSATLISNSAAQGTVITPLKDTPVILSPQGVKPKEIPEPKGLEFQGVPLQDAYKATGVISREVAEYLLRELMFERDQRPEPRKSDFKTGGKEYNHYEESGGKTTADRVAELKASREFKAGLEAIEAAFKRNEAYITQKYAAGKIDYLKYLTDLKFNERKYYDNSLDYYKKHLTKIKGMRLKDDKDFQSLRQKREDAELKHTQKIAGYKKKQLDKERELEEKKVKSKRYSDSYSDISDESDIRVEIMRMNELASIRTAFLRKERDLYKQGTKEWIELNERLLESKNEADLTREELFQKKVNEMRKEYTRLSAADRYKLEMQTLDLLHSAGKVKEEEYEKAKKAIRDKYKDELPQKNAGKSSYEVNADDAKAKYQKEILELQEALAAGLITQEEFELKSRHSLEDMVHQVLEPIKNSNEWLGLLLNMGESWALVWDSMGESTSSVLERVSKAAQATFAVVSAAMQMASQFAQANAEIEVKKIEKRYEREAELAQGNTYLTKKLEKEKQQKVAEIKNKASEASFKMQVIQATATMITGAMNAYTSTLEIPIVGPALAPAAAAVALAAGAANLALLKKQQEASASQGYAEGGYTRAGSKYEVAGVVHAGEWVAPKELLENPVTAGVIARLDRVRASGDVSALENMADFARRNDPVATLTAQDASRVVATGAMVRAADVIARGRSMQHANLDRGVNEVSAPGNGLSATDSDTLRQLSEVVGRLAQRLDEPFVTVNTVTGDAGIKRAQDEYNRMMRNKKRRR